MRELTLTELEIVFGSGNANQCKSDVLGGATIGAVAGSAIVSVIPAFIPIAAGVGAVVGGAVAAAKSPACDGTDY